MFSARCHEGTPFRVEDFRDALAGLTSLNEVLALGACQMNHVSAVTFKTAEGKKKMLATPNLTVNGRRCVVIDPSKQDVRINPHWLLYNVGDDDVGGARPVTREKWRVDGCTSVSTTTRRRSSDSSAA